MAVKRVQLKILGSCLLMTVKVKLITIYQKGCIYN